MVMNPGMFGMNEEQMAQAKEVGNHLKMEVKKYRRTGKVEIQFTKINKEEDFDLGQPVDQLCNQLTWGFSKFFGVKGKIVDVE